MPSRPNPKTKQKLPPGAAFQRLIGVIENSLSGSSACSVTAPDHLRDRDTGRLREHDVVLRFKHGHHLHITAIECRDRSRRTGVPEVEQFQKKCERTGVHRPMMVSQLGFTKSALDKASAMGVECFTLDEIEALPWCLMQHVTVRSTKLLAGRLLPLPQPNNVETMSLYVRPEVLVDKKLRHAIAQHCISDWCATADRTAGRYKVGFLLHGSDYYFVDADGTEHVVDEMRAELVFELLDSVSPITFQKYCAHNGEEVADVAFAEFPLGEHTAKLMMVGPKDGDKSVLLAFDPTTKS